jgi:hypothetical protein
LIEICPNLRSLVFALALPSLTTNPGSTTASHRIDEDQSKALSTATSSSDVKIEVTHDGVVTGLLITPTQVVIANVAFPFPQRIDPRSLQQSIVHRDLILRFQLEHIVGLNRPSNLIRNKHYEVLPLLQIKFLQHITQVQCRQCHHRISRWNQDSPLFDRIRILPSSGWHELVECWACHEQAITMPSSGDARVGEAGTCMVGPSYLLLHEANWDPESIVWEQDPRVRSIHFAQSGVQTRHQATKGIFMAKCAQCSNVLGALARTKSDTFHSNSKAMHLFKTSIIAQQGTISWNLAKVAQQGFMVELLDLVTSHAAHRVMLMDLQHTELAVIWVLNWNSNVRMNSKSSPNALKLLYREVKGEDRLNVEFDAQPPLPLPDPRLIMEILRECNQLLPPSQQQFQVMDQVWKVAYLMQ